MNYEYMRRAIELARRGIGKTNPNPLVGAVIVKDNKIIGEGYHHAYGDLHAERDALKNCYERGENPKGAEIYVTLEPCSHYGKQPPCTLALVEAGISHVYVGSSDPNPLVHGKGNFFLRQNNIQVTEDFLKKECDELNPIFFHYITSGLPYVALKYAMTMDGKIATKSGESKWISNDKSRHFVHELRNQYAAIMCGINTVLKDDPSLTCRLHTESGSFYGRNPLRVVCDSSLRLPMDCKIVQSAYEIPTLVAYSKAGRSQEELQKLQAKKSLLEENGVEVICTDLEEDGLNKKENLKPQVNLNQLVKILGEKKIDSLLVEGGAEIHYSALQAQIVQKIYAFVAPKIFGGHSRSPVEGEGINSLSEAYMFKLKDLRRFDDDVLMEFCK